MFRYTVHHRAQQLITLSPRRHTRPAGRRTVIERGIRLRHRFLYTSGVLSTRVAAFVRARRRQSTGGRQAGYGVEVFVRAGTGEGRALFRPGSRRMHR